MLIAPSQKTSQCITHVEMGQICTAWHASPLYKDSMVCNHSGVMAVLISMVYQAPCTRQLTWLQVMTADKSMDVSRAVPSEWSSNIKT